MADKKVILVTGAGSGIGRAVAEVLARAGHCVYASMRSVADLNKARAEAFAQLSSAQQIDLRTVELDVLSGSSCRAAVDRILFEQGRLDVVVNNAGMLMVGIAEAFTPEQVARIIDTNAISWLRVNRAALPAMRRQGCGVLIYIGSTTARVHEPFSGPYIASKVAGEALAEVMAFEVSGAGIESVIIVPGGFTSGTEHFAHAQAPADLWRFRIARQGKGHAIKYLLAAANRHRQSDQAAPPVNASRRQLALRFGPGRHAAPQPLRWVPDLRARQRLQ